MRKNILILVGAVVLFSLFNTASTNFIFWNIPSVDNTNINSPEIPVSFNTEPSVFGLIINFFTQLDCSIDKASNYEVANIISDFSNSRYKDQSLWILLNYFNQDEIISQDSINYELVDTNLVDFYNPINNWNKNKLIKDNKKLEEIYSKFEESD